MEKDYKYYKNLPELDEAKIESLIRLLLATQNPKNAKMRNNSELA